MELMLAPLVGRPSCEGRSREDQKQQRSTEAICLDAEDAAQGGRLSLDLALDREAWCRTRTEEPFLTVEAEEDK